MGSLRSRLFTLYGRNVSLLHGGELVQHVPSLPAGSPHYATRGTNQYINLVSEAESSGMIQLFHVIIISAAQQIVPSFPLMFSPMR